jgi:hypothetical protein
MIEQHITKASEAREETVGKGPVNMCGLSGHAS